MDFKITPYINRPTKNQFLLVFLFSSIWIITTSVFNGGISPDSTSYLRMANFDLPYFSTWPWGYPILIKFTSLLLDNINLFWASKILNIACVFGNLIILKSLFKGYSLQSYYYIFLTSSFLLISNYTWSENPFIFFNLLFIWSVVKVIENDNKLLFSVMVVLSTVSAFLVRYIGIFHLLSLGLLFLYFLFTKNKKQSFRFLFLCLISGTFIFGYFLLNKTLTGSFTGGRVPAEESFALLLRELLISFFKDLKPLFISLSIFLILIIAFENRRETPLAKNKFDLKKLLCLAFLFYFLSLCFIRFVLGQKFHFRYAIFVFLILFPLVYILANNQTENYFEKNKISKQLTSRLLTLSVSGFSLLFLLCYTRFNYYFDMFNPRLTFPISLYFFLTVLLLLNIFKTSHLKYFHLIFISIIFFSLGKNLLYQTKNFFKDKSNTYIHMMTAKDKQLSKLHDSSAVYPSGIRTIG
ncbi:MAG: hypothetical protein OXC48_06945 [Endozoicomonadaceae bacterium]|nr:hypothetical protein [Endozoicomonadaceae bacterium]